MISLYTLQRFVHFSPQDSIASAWFSHCMMFEKRMTETQSFRNNHSLLRVDRYTYFPLHLLAHLFKRSCNLLNYARAHNSLWLHTEVSSMNNLMIPLSLGGGPYKNRQHWVLQVPQSTQMWVLVATLSKPLLTISHLSWISLKPKSTSTSIAWQYNSNVEVTPRGLIRKQVIGTTSTTSQYPQFN